jgi:hypothetical protein
MASHTAMDTLDQCKNTWPTNQELFEAAKVKAPHYASHLDRLMDLTMEAMREKDNLDHRVGQVLDLEVMIAYDWPTNFSLFSMAINKLNALQDYEISEELDDRWDRVNDGIFAKRNLDATIVQILDNTFAADAELTQDSWPLQHQTEYITPPASPRRSEPPPIQRNRSVVHDVLAESGAFDTPPLPPGPYDHLTEQDYNEGEKNQPVCEYCHPDSGCDADHTDEMRDGFLVRKGPPFSPITVPSQAIMDYSDEVDTWARDLARIVAESKALREAPLSAFADLANLEDDDTIPEVDIEAA